MSNFETKNRFECLASKTTLDDKKDSKLDDAVDGDESRPKWRSDIPDDGEGFGDYFDVTEDIKNGYKWFAFVTIGDGCGGAWDYNVCKYRCKQTDATLLIEYGEYHDDSCDGYEIITNNKIIHPDLWEAECKFVQEHHGCLLPRLP